MSKRIALLGDYNDEVLAHRAIAMALDQAIEQHGKSVLSYEWIHSKKININELNQYAGFWVVPASPYASMENILAAITYARTNDKPFLGTCGGYQHAALEYARNVLKLSDADNAEVNPETEFPLISALSCKLYEVTDTITLTPNSFVHSIYGADSVTEGYHCGYGVGAQYLDLFKDSGLSFTGFDETGDPRVFELSNHRFFVGTAYQPERAALAGNEHPIINRFINCALD